MNFSLFLALTLLSTALAVTKEQIKKNPSRGEENRRHPENKEGDILPRQKIRTRALEDEVWSPSKYEENVGTEYIEGDILAPPSDRERRNLVISKSRRWPNNVLKYKIDSTVTDSVTLNNIKSAVAKLSKHFEGCLKFQQVYDTNGVIVIYPSSGCSANLGFSSYGRMAMRLSRYCPTGSVMHEFLHSLGIHHEQTREDRDKYVRIHFGNIRKGTEFNFKKGSSSTYSTMGFNYDYNSIMHYGAYAFSTNRQKTIEVLKAGAKIGQRSDLSANDVARVKKMYNCNGSGGGSTGGGGNTGGGGSNTCTC